MALSGHHTSKIEVICKSIATPSFLPLTDMFDFSERTLSVFAINMLEHKLQIERYASLLNDEETLKAGRFFKKDDRDRYILSRSVVKKLGSRYLKISPNQIYLSEGKNKKPYFNGYEDLHFNISHSGNFTVIAFNREEIGIDIEYADPHLDYSEIIKEVFSETEKKEIKESKIPINAFYRFWTRKEALLKGTAKGIDEDLVLISCLDGPNYPGSARIDSDQNWTIDTFCIEDHFCSLAYFTGTLSNALYHKVDTSFISDDQ